MNILRECSSTLNKALATVNEKAEVSGTVHMHADFLF